MFLHFAVAFLEYSENLHLIRGGKKKGSLKIKNTSPKLSNDFPSFPNFGYITKIKNVYFDLERP